MKFHAQLAAVLIGLVSPSVVLAQEIDTGDTAWMLTSSALVLFMLLKNFAFENR